MTESAAAVPASPGEAVVQPVTADQTRFLAEVGYPNLNKATTDDPLKHIADVWWNLCQWEKQRADVLDGKAQALLGLASIAGAVVSVAGPVLAQSGLGTTMRVCAITTFLVTAILAVRALRITEYGGFIDADVFGALSLFESKTDPAASTDPHQFRVYLRDVTVQRWLVYSSYKAASATKADRVENAQIAAIVALVFLVAAIVFPILGV